MGRSELDHLVWAVPDLAAGIADLAARTGVTASAGGRHPGIGTHNALLDLGARRYLEILAPDPTQDRFSSFGRLIRDLRRPTLLTWSARHDDLTEVRDAADAAGMVPGPILALARDRPDGSRLSWRLMQLAGHGGGELVPFFVEWRDGEHPSRSAAAGCRLVGLDILTPRPAEVDRLLAALGLEERASPADGPALRAHLHTPRGRVTLA